MPNKFTVVKKGYDISEVDEHIESLENVIKSYKEKDAAIKNAILSAQVAADNIIQNAKNRSYEMKENATAKIKDIVASVDVQKNMLENFKTEYNNQIKKYLQDINDRDIAAIYDKINALENYVRRFTEDEPEPTSSILESASVDNSVVSDAEKEALKSMFSN